MMRLGTWFLWQRLRWYNRVRSALRLRVPLWAQPMWHQYTGYKGPWIENYFFAYWCQWEQDILARRKISSVYVPVWWTDCYHTYGKRPQARLQRWLSRHLREDTRYFTVVQNDDGILEDVPSNLTVFGAGGVGDVPIPLIKDRLVAPEGKRDILCSFMGLSEGAHDRTGVRSRMKEALSREPGFYFGSGSLQEFIGITSRSIFALCPRGWGRTSFRLYEAIALGTIPVYIWDDVPWLPYADTLDWEQLGVSVNVRDISRVPEIVRAHTPEMITAKRRALQERYEAYFTLEGTSAQIVRMLQEQGE
jgi:hypothetical protein